MCHVDKLKETIFWMDRESRGEQNFHRPVIWQEGPNVHVNCLYYHILAHTRSAA